MGFIRSFYSRCRSLTRILERMSNERERVISITLSEAEWQAFIARQPEPVAYLRERIRDVVVREPEQQSKSAA